MNYYNEFDPNASAWLRELIAEGLIPKGDVDDRSIADVAPGDLRGYKQCHFFAGIGGWSYALQLAGWDANRPVWTGSCPCQAFSTAGKQKGFADERDLWPVFFRLIKECRPEYVFGEQVENAIKHGWLDRVYRDMEGEGYSCGSVVLGAHSIGSPHQRQRLYWGGTLAENPAGGGRRGRHYGNPSGNDRQVQAAGLCGDSGVMAYPERERHEEQWRGKPISEDRTRQTQPSIELSSNTYRVADNSIIGSAAGVSRQNKREERQSGIIVNGDTQSGMEYTANNGFNGVHPECGGLAEECGMFQFEGKSYSSNPWERYQLIYCQDGAVRRIPAESVFLGVADGLPKSMDGCGDGGISEENGFPLTKQKEGRPMLLKGYGNAIVPQVAAEFIKAFEEVMSEK